MKKDTREALKRAAEEFDGSLYRSDCFIGGADWYRNNIWHESIEEPINDGGVDIVWYEEPIPEKPFFLISDFGWEYLEDTDTWEDFLGKHQNVRLHWAYFEDFLP